MVDPADSPAATPLIMQVQPVLNTLLASLSSQSSLADDPAVEEAATALVEALGPALRLAAMELAQQAAEEMNAQLTDNGIDIVMVDGDPTLRVTDSPAAAPTDQAAEDLDARITLRLPPTLKRMIEHAATIDGDSVNAWVVDTLSKRTNRSEGRGRRVTEGFDL